MRDGSGLQLIDMRHVKRLRYKNVYLSVQRLHVVSGREVLHDAAVDRHESWPT